ncbi:hypothetical protein SNE40_017149 [Patella caerulea]|uniref:Uncharacterized protein n=1 Tax=Patella caerulea TaxID=87958 RepID=A0AAN8J9U9_PATCE
MFGWIKKRCRRRSLPPSIKQLQEEEANRTRASENVYFNLDEDQDDHVYEEVCTDTYSRANEQREYENIAPHSDETVCPLCRSIRFSSSPCECTNVYEEPCISTNSNDCVIPSVENEYDMPTTPTTRRTPTQKKSSNAVNRYTLASSLDVVYELATCPFKVPKPIKKRPVNRSVSDAGSSRPLPQIPIHGRQRTFTETNESVYDDDSSGFYESIGSDCESGSDGNGYSNIASSNEDFHGFIHEDIVYEEFDFKPDVSPPEPSRRYSLGSATPGNTFYKLHKRETTLSHGDHLHKVAMRENSRRNGPLFRSFRVRSLFK